VFQSDDPQRGRLIECLMCDFKIAPQDLAQFAAPDEIARLLADTAAALPGVVDLTGGVLSIPLKSRALTRIIACSHDACDQSKA